eukprot:m.363995 g.363995  ORF g.363995 m.363995 type:complete len:2032 (+) comp25059_c0_seq1:716-6811(+)
MSEDHSLTTNSVSRVPSICTTSNTNQHRSKIKMAFKSTTANVVIIGTSDSFRANLCIAIRSQLGLDDHDDALATITVSDTPALLHVVEVGAGHSATCHADRHALQRADVAVLVFSPRSQKSLDAILVWHRDIASSSRRIPTILVACDTCSLSQSQASLMSLKPQDVPTKVQVQALQEAVNPHKSMCIDYRSEEQVSALLEACARCTRCLPLWLRTTPETFGVFSTTSECTQTFIRGMLTAGQSSTVASTGKAAAAPTHKPTATFAVPVPETVDQHLHAGKQQGKPAQRSEPAEFNMHLQFESGASEKCSCLLVVDDLTSPTLTTPAALARMVERVKFASAQAAKACDQELGAPCSRTTLVSGLSASTPGSSSTTSSRSSISTRSNDRYQCLSTAVQIRRPLLPIVVLGYANGLLDTSAQHAHGALQDLCRANRNVYYSRVEFPLACAASDTASSVNSSFSSTSSLDQAVSTLAAAILKAEGNTHESAMLLTTLFHRGIFRYSPDDGARDVPCVTSPSTDRSWGGRTSPRGRSNSMPSRASPERRQHLRRVIAMSKQQRKGSLQMKSPEKMLDAARHACKERRKGHQRTTSRRSHAYERHRLALQHHLKQNAHTESDSYSGSTVPSDDEAFREDIQRVMMRRRRSSYGSVAQSSDSASVVSRSSHFSTSRVRDVARRWAQRHSAQHCSRGTGTGTRGYRSFSVGDASARSDLDTHKHLSDSLGQGKYQDGRKTRSRSSGAVVTNTFSPTTAESVTREHGSVCSKTLSPADRQVRQDMLYGSTRRQAQKPQASVTTGHSTPSTLMLDVKSPASPPSDLPRLAIELIQNDDSFYVADTQFIRQESSFLSVYSSSSSSALVSPHLPQSAQPSDEEHASAVDLDDVHPLDAMHGSHTALSTDKEDTMVALNAMMAELDGHPTTTPKNGIDASTINDICSLNDTAAPQEVETDMETDMNINALSSESDYDLDSECDSPIAGNAERPSTATETASPAAYATYTSSRTTSTPLCVPSIAITTHRDGDVVDSVNDVTIHVTNASIDEGDDTNPAIPLELDGSTNVTDCSTSTPVIAANSADEEEEEDDWNSEDDDGVWTPVSSTSTLSEKESSHGARSQSPLTWATLAALDFAAPVSSSFRDTSSFVASPLRSMPMLSKYIRSRSRSTTHTADAIDPAESEPSQEQQVSLLSDEGEETSTMESPSQAQSCTSVLSSAADSVFTAGAWSTCTSRSSSADSLFNAVKAQKLSLYNDSTFVSARTANQTARLASSKRRGGGSLFDQLVQQRSCEDLVRTCNVSATQQQSSIAAQDIAQAISPTVQAPSRAAETTPRARPATPIPSVSPSPNTRHPKLLKAQSRPSTPEGVAVRATSQLSKLQAWQAKAQSKSQDMDRRDSALGVDSTGAVLDMVGTMRVGIAGHAVPSSAMKRGALMPARRRAYTVGSSTLAPLVHRFSTIMEEDETSAHSKVYADEPKQSTHSPAQETDVARKNMLCDSTRGSMSSCTTSDSESDQKDASGNVKRCAGGDKPSSCSPTLRRSNAKISLKEPKTKGSHATHLLQRALAQIDLARNLPKQRLDLPTSTSGVQDATSYCSLNEPETRPRSLSLSAASSLDIVSQMEASRTRSTPTPSPLTARPATTTQGAAVSSPSKTLVRRGLQEQHLNIVSMTPHTACRGRTLSLSYEAVSTPTGPPTVPFDSGCTDIPVTSRKESSRTSIDSGTAESVEERPRLGSLMVPFLERPMTSWSIEEVVEYVRSLDPYLSEHSATLRQERVSGAILASVTVSDLCAMGLTPVQARFVVRHRNEQLFSETAPSPATMRAVRARVLSPSSPRRKEEEAQPKHRPSFLYRLLHLAARSPRSRSSRPSASSTDSELPVETETNTQAPSSSSTQTDQHKSLQGQPSDILQIVSADNLYSQLYSQHGASISDDEDLSFEDVHAGFDAVGFDSSKCEGPASGNGMDERSRFAATADDCHMQRQSPHQQKKPTNGRQTPLTPHLLPLYDNVGSGMFGPEDSPSSHGIDIFAPSFRRTNAHATLV